MELEKIENLYNLIGSYVRENNYISLQELFNGNIYTKEEIKEALNFKNNIGEHLFFQACRSRDIKNISIVDLLIENGADPFIENELGRTILNYDITSGMREYISNYHNENIYNELEKCVQNKDYYRLTYLLTKYKNILDKQTQEEKNNFIETVKSTENEILLNIIQSSSVFGSILNQQNEVNIKLQNIDYKIAFNELESELITCISKADYKKMESLLNDAKYKDCIKDVLNRKNFVGESLLFNVCRNHNLRATNQRMTDEIAVKMIDLMCANGTDIFSTDKTGKNVEEITTSPMLKEYIKQKQTTNIYNKICNDIKNKNYCEVFNIVSQHKEYLLQLYIETGRTLNLIEFAKNQNDLLTQQILESLKLYQPIIQKDARQYAISKEDKSKYAHNIINKCIVDNNYELLYTVCNSDEYKPFIKDVLNKKNEKGETLFSQACINGNLAIIKVCIESGANVFIKNKEGKYIKDYNNVNDNVKKYITDYCNSIAFDEAKKCIENKDYGKLCDLVVDYKEAILQKRIQTRDYDNTHSFNLLQIAIDSGNNKAFEIIKSSGLYAENKFIGSILERGDNLTEDDENRIKEILTTINSGNVDELNNLITNPEYVDCVINYKNKDYESILFDVCKNKTLSEEKAIQMTDLLVDNGVNIFTTNYENKTCLEYVENPIIREHIYNIQKNNSYNRALTCINTENYIELEKLLSQHKDVIVNKHIDSNGRLNLFEVAKRKNNLKAQEIISSLKIYDNLENKQKIENPQEKIEEEKKELKQKPVQTVQEKPIQQIQTIQSTLKVEQNSQNKQVLSKEVKQTKEKEGKLKRFFKKIKKIFSSSNGTEEKKQPKTNKKITNNKTTKQSRSIANLSLNEKMDDEIVIKEEQKQVAGMLSKTFGKINTSQSTNNINSASQISIENIDINELIPEELRIKLYETTKQIGDELLKQNCKAEDVEMVVKIMQDECLKKSFVDSSNKNKQRKSIMIGSL